VRLLAALTAGRTGGRCVIRIRGDHRHPEQQTRTQNYKFHNFLLIGLVWAPFMGIGSRLRANRLSALSFLEITGL
jgi:hypothetical protein